MKKLIITIFTLFTLSACMGTRGRINGQKVCTNDYFLGVLSISELFDPCGK